MEKLRIFIKQEFKKVSSKITHCCEALRFILSKYFGKKKGFRGTFGEIWHIQI